MHVGRIGLCLLGVVAAAGPAAAGPIWFTYRVDGTTTRFAGGEVLFHPTYSDSTRLDAGTVPTLPLATVGVGLNPPLILVPTGGSDANADGLSRFAVKVQITDGATSAVGEARFTGWAQRWAAPDKSEFVAGDGLTIGFDDAFWDVPLGGHTYRIVASGVSGSGGDVTGTLSVEVVSPAGVPEPGTVVLAGLGLAGLIGFVRRR